MIKTAVLESLDSPKLISRKIWVIEKSWNFHTVAHYGLSILIISIFRIKKLTTFIIPPLEWIKGNQQQFMLHMEWFPKIWLQPTFFLSLWIQFILTCLKISEFSSRISEYYLKSHRFSLIWHMKIKQNSCKIGKSYLICFLVQDLRFHWTIRYLCRLLDFQWKFQSEKLSQSKSI